MQTTSLKPLLEVRGLKQYFTGGTALNKKIVKAVDDVSFSINKGQVMGLVGESGCGKTTTGRTIIRLYQPTAGEVYLDNELISGPLNKAQLRAVTRGVQMIFQDPVASLNPRMTIEEIIGEGLKMAGMKNRRERLEHVYTMLDKVGLTKDHATRYPHEFSGGQRQRVGIARALISNPSLIIADEPVSALDVSIQAQVLNLLGKLKEEEGLTMLFIAHDLSVAKYFCHRIGVMYMGKLVEIADSEELYSCPLHPYTRALLSAIPQPDPLYERKRARLRYDPAVHDYENDPPRYHEIRPGHLVYASHQEAELFRQMA